MTQLPSTLVQEGQSAIVETAESGAVAAMARERYEIEGAMILARRFPRDEHRCRTEIVRAVSRPTFAEEALYSFPRGNQTVEGASVRMAREMSRIWGNIRSGFRVISMDQRAQEVHVQGFAFDVQTNAFRVEEGKARTRIYRKGKGWIDLLKDDIGGDTERQLAELVGRVGAKLERNCLLRLLPADLLDESIEQVKIAQAQGAVDPAKLRGVVSFFGSKGVNMLKLERLIGCRLKDMRPADLAKLRRIATSVQQGEASIAEFFPDDDESSKPVPDEKKKPQTEVTAGVEPSPEYEHLKSVAGVVPEKAKASDDDMLGDFEQPKPGDVYRSIAADEDETRDDEQSEDEVRESDALGKVSRKPQVWRNKTRAPKNAQPGDIWDQEGSDESPKVLDVDGEWKVSADAFAAGQAIIATLEQQEADDAQKVAREEGVDEERSDDSPLPRVIYGPDAPDNFPGAWWIRSDGRVFKSDGETYRPEDETQLVNMLANRVADIAKRGKLSKDKLVPIIKSATGKEPTGLLSMSARDLYITKNALEARERA